MSENNLPRFFDAHLQESAQKSAATLNHFKTNLDTVSSDIRALERWLQDASICLPFALEFNRRYELLEPNGHDEANGFYQGPARKITERLSWERHSVSGRWRILYIREVAGGELSLDGGTVDHSSFGKSEQEELRPLIETPGQIRLAAHKKLPELLSIICEGAKPKNVPSQETEFWQTMRHMRRKEATK